MVEMPAQKVCVNLIQRVEEKVARQAGKCHVLPASACTGRQ